MHRPSLPASDEKSNDSLIVTLGRDQSKILASLVLRSSTKLLVIFDSAETFIVQIRSINEISLYRDKLSMALYRAKGLHRYCEWLKEYFALREEHRGMRDLYLQHSARPLAEKSKLAMENGPIGIPALHEGREYEHVNAEEMEVYLAICEVCRNVTSQMISLAPWGSHGSSRDIYVNRGDGKRHVRTDVIARLLSQGSKNGWHVSLRVKIFDSTKPKIIQIGHPDDILASSHHVISALLKCLSSR